jgi:hypothetical protein
MYKRSKMSEFKPNRMSAAGVLRPIRTNPLLEEEVQLSQALISNHAVNLNTSVARSTTENQAPSTTLRAVLSTNLFEETVFSIAYVTVRNNELPPRIAWFLMVHFQKY